MTGGSGGKNGCKVNIESADGGKKETLECDVILVSTGRRPYTQGLQLDKVGLETDK